MNSADAREPSNLGRAYATAQRGRRIIGDRAARGVRVLRGRSAHILTAQSHNNGKLHPAPPRWPSQLQLSDADVVDLGYRLILGRAPDQDSRNGALNALGNGSTRQDELLANLAASPEFAQRVAHARAVIEVAQPPSADGLVDVHELGAAKSIEQHNAAAEAYFASRERDIVEWMLAKPFAAAAETTELLTCFGHMIAGLRLLPGDRLLDFGVGTGWTSWMFAQLGCQVISTDVSAAALDLAQERFTRWPLSPGRPSPQFQVFDGHRFDLPDASVDKICCFDAFHHLINQAEVMTEFARVLKPGGVAGFDEPGRHHSRTPAAQFEMRTFGVVEGDMDLTDMARMAADAGLEFVAADLLTTRPIWADLETFTDLVDTRLLTASMAQQAASQIEAKQLFILRKPGGSGTDSRDRTAIGAELTLLSATAVARDDFIDFELELTVANTGTGRWLAYDCDPGGVSLRARSPQRPGWEISLAAQQNLALDPGETNTIRAQVRIPGDLADASLLVNLVAERVGWFDICGVPPIEIDLPALS